MLNFILGLVAGAAFAPFWITLWKTYVKPAIDKVLNKKTS